jgi:hypothetical protein
MLLLDLPRFFYCMRPKWVFSGAYSWVKIRNRNEKVTSKDGHVGVSCNWKWTSDVMIARWFPVLGRWLMRRALRDFPVVLQKEPPDYGVEECPDISFLIGHKGLDRLPALLMTLRSIAGQTGCKSECVVVEQDTEIKIAPYLPAWVRYKHAPPDQPNMPFSRSQAFNEAAAMAQAECVIFHDNDMLVPCNYAALVRECHQEGFEVVNLKRFIFYLDEKDTGRALERGSLAAESALKAVMQNAEGGGSVGMDIRAYWSIGGFDNSFVGWGGEDNEFWERAKTRKTFEYGFLPMVHLWHPPQVDKADSQVRGVEQYRVLTSIPPSERITALVSRNK